MLEGSARLTLADTPIEQGIQPRRLTESFDGNMLTINDKRSDRVASLKDQLTLVKLLGQRLDKGAETLHFGFYMALHTTKVRKKVCLTNGCQTDF